MIRRSQGLNQQNMLVLNGLSLDLNNRTASFYNQKLSLHGKEFDLVQYLIQNQGRIVTKDQLFDRIWDFQSDTTLTVVEVYMSRLRKRLKDQQVDQWIKALRNVGYPFEPFEVKTNE